jgi:hypothetical protein
MFHDEGASTAVTGSFVSSRALITAGNGSRTSPVNEKPANWLGAVRFMREVEGWKTKNGVYDVVRVFHGGLEILGERDVEIL